MNVFGAISYGLPAALFALLALLLLTSWRGRLQGALLVAACMVTAGWAVAEAMEAGYRTLPTSLLFGLEILRAGVWIMFLGSVLATLGFSRRMRLAANAVWTGLFAAGLLAWALHASGADIQVPGRVISMGGLALALVGLVLVEQLYRNSPTESRWAVKMLCLGVGGMFAYDLFMYAQAYLLGGVDDQVWLARGLVNALLVPMVAIAARRNPHWSLDVFVSRHVVFYSTTLIAVGLYLLLMSLGGYYIRLYGGSWSGVLQAIFFAGAVMVLATLLFSTQWRARFRVFLSKHFFRNRYDYREEWLRFIDALSEATGSGLIISGAIDAVAQVIKSPGGAMWVRDAERGQWVPLGQYNAQQQEEWIIDDRNGLLAFLRERQWIVDLHEYDDRPELYGELTLPGFISSAYPGGIIVPMLLGRELFGVLVLRRPDGLKALNYEDRDLLKTLGKQVATYVRQNEADRKLSEARQFEAYNRLSAFIMHDLKNVIAQQSLVVANAEKHKHNPEFVNDAVSTVANSVQRMTRLLETLQRGRAGEARRELRIGEMVDEAIRRCSGREPEPRRDSGLQDFRVSANPEQLAGALEHLLRNAQDATPADGKVWIGYHVRDGRGIVEVGDTGCGMSADFVHNRLFQPFDSTKGSKGMGIGAYQAREYLLSMGGQVKVDTSPGRGTVFRVVLPVVEESAQSRDGEAVVA